MLALLTSILLIAYLIIPGVVFRTFFSFFVPLKAFDRTRTQEFAYSVVVCAVPFLVALSLVQHTRLGSWPFSFRDTWEQRDADYQEILLTCFGDGFHTTGEAFLNAATRSCMRQGRLLFWYLTFVSLEGLVLGFVGSKSGTLLTKLTHRPMAAGLLERVLLGNVYEWHVLLTPFLFPGRTMHVDTLTVDDHLYQGDVLSYTRDREGKLTGIYLNNAERYDRMNLLADRQKNVIKSTAEYWKPIPGKRLFLFADKLSTLNIRPQTSIREAEKLAAQVLNRTVTVTVDNARTGESEATPGNPAAESQTK